MTPEEIGQRFVARFGDGVESETSFGAVTVTLPAYAYADAAAFAKTTRGLDFTFFDFLTGVDEAEAGYGVVTHLYSPIHRHHVLLRTVVPNDLPRLPSLTQVFAGANWHERETWEMFGIVFDGHPNLVKLLLSDEFEGHPLRKEFLLTSRVVKPWPGAKEPGE
ncbi:MAG TPA: NADH-quinone oxidoreductase subunit C [Mycobacteriales bacterium]|jgi:NADH-quinone oxidoreductase subunit C|nr:NADH-quinone oxidoreductase subunit C [Mycobacteriales bacterium]